MNKQLLQTAKPILFNTEMVKAILDGRKTQTRRLAKGKNFTIGYVSPDFNLGSFYFFEKNKTKNKWKETINFYDANSLQELSNLIIKNKDFPFNVGNILYVRETFVLEGMTYDKNGEIIHHKEPIIHYKADGKELNWVDEWENECNIPWKPSIHMPKKYARIFLKVTSVRVERLQDISFPEDYEAEGSDEFYVFNNPPYNNNENKLKEWWTNLWNSTTKDGYKWEDNPYVLVYEFEKVKVC